MSQSTIDMLPPEFADDGIADRVRAGIAASGSTLVALDDDPTGVQTVHDVPVLARWDIADLIAVLEERHSLFFILTNSRSLAVDDVINLNREIVTNLVVAADRSGTRFAIASRSDSTLRGHFPAETDAIAQTLGGVDGVLLAPAFFEGGRLTIDDIHWVRDGDRMIPAAETEFARDPTFGYASSNLRAWVAEKSSGRLTASSVVSIGLEDIRRGGPARVAEQFLAVDGGRVVVVNAESYRDLEVVVLGLLEAEAAGKRFIYRTGASFVRARAAIDERPLLDRKEIVGSAGAPLAGLVVVGSHVGKSSEQLARLIEKPDVVPVELSVPEILSEAHRAEALSSAGSAIDAALARNEVPVLFTSREVVKAGDPEMQLEISRAVSSALVAVVRGLGRRPGWIVAKGGITSSDVGTKGLGVRRALVLGQVRPGVPVWQLGPEARFPGLGYVVFPGNVGGPDTLIEVVALLRGKA